MNPTDPASGRDRFWLLSALVGALAFVACFLALRDRLLPGADSYSHLAIARAIAAHGPLRDLPWARFSAMRHGFGDLEFLFHLLLAPFGGLASWPDPRLAGALAVAVWIGLLTAVLGDLAAAAIGPWGLAVPLVLAVTAPEVTERLARLRPELFSLLLLLLIIWATAHRRERLVGALAFVYALGYPAFHALLGLVLAFFLFIGWRHRRWEWGLPLYTVLGVGLALVIHPNFPKNLEIWVLQDIDLFRLHGQLDAGTEYLPNTTAELFLGNLGWFLAITALWCLPRGTVAPERDPASDPRDRAAELFGIATAAFALLYLLMSRFCTYVYPFATLWTLFELRRRGRLGRPWRVLGDRRLPLGAVLAIALLVALPSVSQVLRRLALESDPGPHAERIAERATVARLLPAGARVAAIWWSTPVYMFWAPQALYLNVFDPVFMAVPFPQVYAAQRAVFAGNEPDAPLVLNRLASDYVVVPDTAAVARLVDRLSADPRVVTLHRGGDAVFRLEPRNHAFVLDWQGAQGTAYPRLRPGGGGEIEGYVDARRLEAANRCVDLTHREVLAAPARITWEFAPSGPSRLALDSVQAVATGSSLHAVLGRGLTVPVQWQAGSHTIDITTCPDDESVGRLGFYLLERERRAP